MDKQLKANLEKLALRDNAIMRIIKSSAISHVVAETSRGTLTLKLPFKGNADDYIFVLDAVPFSEVENKELMLLFAGVIINTLTI